MVQISSTFPVVRITLYGTPQFREPKLLSLVISQLLLIQTCSVQRLSLADNLLNTGIKSLRTQLAVARVAKTTRRSNSGYILRLKSRVEADIAEGWPRG
jgi:hypothetical protein